MNTKERIEKMMRKVKPILEADCNCKNCKHIHEISPNEYVCFKYQKAVKWDEHNKCFECIAQI